MQSRRVFPSALISLALLAGVLASGAVAAGAAPGNGNDGAAEHWTPERRAAAIPRDLLVDHRGLGYSRGANGELEPYGHGVAAQHAPLQATSEPGARAKPGGAGGGNDSTPPVISDMDPAGIDIGASYTFSARIVDPGSGVRSATFVIRFPNGTQTQSFSPSRNGDIWSTTIQGFTDGAWSWHVVAKDNGPKGGNTATSAVVPFTVATSDGGGGGGGGDVVTNAAWTEGGAVQSAAGRIYFEMPTNKRKNRWSGYVCSGTVATESTTGRSIILTAAHCVYDDVNKAFARNVLFIPNQAGTTGAGTDQNCGNDPFGCWSPTHAVVDNDWASQTFPANIPWDVGYYVVPDSGAHSGNTSNEVLDGAVGSLAVLFDGGTSGDPATALGYSYDDDPDFMHCSENLAVESDYGDWWLGLCGLSGGSSGGPWLQPTDGGNGPIISVNSWGYTGAPGMAGPVLSTTASCLFTQAKSVGSATVASC